MTEPQDAWQIERADHYQWSAAVEKLMVAAVREADAPQWIAQVDDGVFEAAVDVLSKHAADDRRVRVEQAPQLSMLCTEQDGVLEPGARTGRLIRVVFQTDAGAAFVLPAVPGQHYVGFRSGMPSDRRYEAVVPADHAMITLVDARRELLGLTSQDPGADKGRPTRHEYGIAPRNPHVTGEGRVPAAVAPFVAAVRGAVDDRVLQWAALVNADDKDQVFTVDQLDHPTLKEDHELISPQLRREFYETFAAGAHTLLGRFTRAARPVLGGAGRCLVLDVEQGAIVVHRLAAESASYLVGVTLFQTQVRNLETRMAELSWVNPRQ